MRNNHEWHTLPSSAVPFQAKTTVPVATIHGRNVRIIHSTHLHLMSEKERLMITPAKAALNVSVLNIGFVRSIIINGDIGLDPLGHVVP